MSRYGLFSPKLVKFCGQDYRKLRFECVKSQCLFEDEEFPAESRYTSIALQNTPFELSACWYQDMLSMY